MENEEKTELQAFNGSEDDAEAGEMFCTKCGKKNRADSAFCGYCGNPFTSFVKYEQEYSKTEISVSLFEDKFRISNPVLLSGVSQLSIALNERSSV